MSIQAVAGGAIQWEHRRVWDLPATSSEFVLAEGALALPGGFSSLSVFFRRSAQSGGQFNLVLWTTPIFFNPLDFDFSNTPDQYLWPLSWTVGTALQMTGTGAKVFGGRIGDTEPIGTLLFWQMENDTASRQSITGDLYVVPNHRGTVSFPSVDRTVATGGGMGAQRAPRIIQR